MQTMAQKHKEIITFITAINGNLALGHLKRGEIDEAEFYNSQCLHYDPENLKGHYRIIQIHLARNELTEA